MRAPELVQHIRLQGEFTSTHERCMSYILYGLAISLAYRSGEEGGNFLVQMISTCLRYAWGVSQQPVILPGEQQLSRLRMAIL